MIDTRFLENPKPIDIDFNDVTQALFDLYDIRETLSTTAKRKATDGLGSTVGTCLDSVIEYLETLERSVYAN
jgi:hypothetical protein